MIAQCRPGQTACAWLVLAYLFSDPAPAWAYIDPGAGSLAFQTIVATLVGAMVFVRRVRAGVATAIRKLVARAGGFPHWNRE